jgi:DNA polymerase-3 subunit epsilon
VTTAEQTQDPARWEDLFVRDVDERSVQFVRPADTDRPTWSLYEATVYRGTVTAESDGGRPLWRVQGTREAHRDLDDAIRVLRRPPSWTREREQVAAWARRLLADDSLLAVDVETTGLENAYAVQIAAVDRRGTVVFNEYVQPNAVLEPAAVAVHGITPDRLAQAPVVFGELLPRLRALVRGFGCYPNARQAPRTGIPEAGRSVVSGFAGAFTRSP